MPMEGMNETLRKILPKAPEGLERGFDEMGPEEMAQFRADGYNATDGDLDKEDGYQCDKCKNKGFVAVPQYNEQFHYWSEALFSCTCCRIRNAIRRLNRSGLKNAVKECTFEKYDASEPWQKTVKETAQRFAAGDGDDWLFIGGQSGAGKTHICTAAAIAKLKKGKSLRYMEWREEVPKIKAAITEAARYEEMTREIKTADVLYIDDLFKTGRGSDGSIAMPTAADINLAFEIINYRCKQPGLVTIISSERTLTELTAIDEAIAGRIAQKSKSKGFCINIGKDARKNWRMRDMVEL